VREKEEENETCIRNKGYNELLGELSQEEREMEV
jgi:hypothetical protein